ncbi:aldo/keto reductase [Streptomyces sp. NPDC127033]|uniref:aldo/keto reductase n=1 Tax=Streptomyces sp. NPDC127033 TaxID=3347110 RepID=UPI0036481EB4
MTRIALGTMRTSGNFNSLMVVDRDADRAAEVVRMATSRIDAFDTAPVYARGLAESDLGRLCHDTPVWTKVGVDVSTTLPTLDYSLPTMVTTLAASCERLQRPSVECVFVHNPPMDVFSGMDWPALKSALVEDGPAENLGVSVLDPSEIELLTGIGTPLVVMAETAVIDRYPELGRKVREAGHRLVLRSLFAGGRRLRAVAAERRAGAVAARMEALIEQFDPWALVIAPRTPPQMADYLDAVDRLREPAGTA